MHKTTLVVDDRMLNLAERILGTKGIKPTVDAALQDVITRYFREHFVEIHRECTDFEVAKHVRKLAWHDRLHAT